MMFIGWLSNWMRTDAKAAMLIIFILYVLPGMNLKFAVVDSFTRSAFGNGGAPRGLDGDTIEAINFGTLSWYQSDIVRTSSSSYWPLYGSFGSCTIRAPVSIRFESSIGCLCLPLKPSGYCPLLWEWYQYVPGLSSCFLCQLQSNLIIVASLL